MTLASLHTLEEFVRQVVQRFEQDFPDSQTILLEQNYRSRQNILNAAMGVIVAAPTAAAIGR